MTLGGRAGRAHTSPLPPAGSPMKRLFALLLPLCLALPAAAVDVDGTIDPAEWQGARHITDFVMVQPLTGAQATHRTQAWILATPQGLAVAFRNDQPPDVPRSTQRTRRDQGGQLDRVNFMVDFDGDGRTGYDFMVTVAGGISDEVITSERNFNTDWDGHWHHAVAQDAQGWSVEMLIPWHVAPMAKPADGKRTLGVYFDRVVGSTGERFGWPNVSFQNPRFLSEFTRIEVPFYEQSLLDANVDGNDARWINHSCDPNCEATWLEDGGKKRKDKIFIEAMRDISAGEELTYNYGIVLAEAHTAKLKKLWACRCGSKYCTGTMLQPKPKKAR